MSSFGLILSADYIVFTRAMHFSQMYVYRCTALTVSRKRCNIGTWLVITTEQFYLSCLLHNKVPCRTSQSHLRSSPSRGDTCLPHLPASCTAADYTVWVKKNPPWGVRTSFHFFHKRFKIANRFFTHLLNVLIFARLQFFIQLSPILTKLCHIKRDNPVQMICAKCPKRAKTRAFRRLRKSLIALLIVVCGKSL